MLLQKRNEAALHARALGQKGLAGQCTHSDVNEMRKWLALVEGLDGILAKKAAPFSLFFSEAQRKGLESMRTSLRCKAAQAGSAFQRASMSADIEEANRQHIVATKASALIMLIDESIGAEEPKPVPVAKSAPKTFPERYAQKLQQWEAKRSRSLAR